MWLSHDLDLCNDVMMNSYVTTVHKSYKWNFYEDFYFFPTSNMDTITLQKCKKCWKSLPLEAFININENTCYVKTCNTYHYKASLQYK